MRQKDTRGGGVRGGQMVGSTGAVGLGAQDDPNHVHGLHAMGLGHRQLHRVHNGRRENPTINSGNLALNVLG